MALTITEAYAHRALLFVASLGKVLPSLTVTQGAALAFNGLTQRAAIAKALGMPVGTNMGAQAMVTQWLVWSESTDAASEPGLAALEAHLTKHAYLAGASYTVADAMVYFLALPALRDGGKAAAFPAVARWALQVQNEPGFEAAAAAGAPAPLPAAAAPRRALQLFGSGAPAAAAPVAEAGAAAAAAGGAPEGGKKKEKKEKPAPAPAPAPAPEADPIAYCDFRVGEIKKVWPHPEAERLYCEEIDVGEAEPRKIASGLREHYTLEQMQGRKVVVICNLKPRALVGFASNGMVLAATSPAGKVELLDPPAGAKVGERISFDGHFAEAAAPNAMAKKKYLEAAVPELRVDEALRAVYKGIPFMTTAGAVTVPTAVGGTIH